MIAHAHWARGAFDQFGTGPLRHFARVREQVPNALGGGEEGVGRTDFHRSVSLAGRDEVGHGLLAGHSEGSTHRTAEQHSADGGWGLAKARAKRCGAIAIAMV